MKIYKIAQEGLPPETDEYMLENGMLYDIDGEDVFNIRELLKHNIPLFKNAQEANTFLETLEVSMGRPLSRVPDKDFMNEVKWRDTGKERADESARSRQKRDKQWNKGKF